MFGMGFVEILIIAVIAILFLGPDKLPSAMVEVAKFFRGVKKTVGDVKDSLEQEMNVADLKEEALAYKKELLKSSQELKEVTNIGSAGASLTNLKDDFFDDDDDDEVVKPKKESVKSEKVTFKKKKTKEEEIKDV